MEGDGENLTVDFLKYLSVVSGNQVQDSLKKLILGKFPFGNDIPIQIKHRQSGKSGRYACGLRKSCEGINLLPANSFLLRAVLLAYLNKTNSGIMSTFFKFLVAALVWLLFYLATFRGCQEELCQACDPPPPVTVADTLPEEAGLPVYFKWSDAEAYIGTGVEAFLRSKATGGDSSQLLEITGLYFEGEQAASGSENLGLARAKEVARLFDGLLDSMRLQLRARQVETPEDAQSAPFEGALFEWVDPKSQSAVDQLADRVSIRFPTGSADRVYAPEVDSFLIELAAQLRSSGQRVRITGHTDNTGSAEKNVGLGLARAEAVKQFLVNAGVPESQLTTDSKGDALPVASNATEEGRYQNRRVEVRIEPQ